ncbi:MAG: hypothetical protein JWQ76_1883 [Ramlibacter sp.]|nr:hypothetical protein [Ramlibacter sp.]
MLQSCFNKTLPRIFMAVAVACGVAPVAAQQYPDKPVKLIVPFPAGMASDLVARVLADGLGHFWKQGAYVDNKPGGASVPGMMALKTAPADGYTLAVASVGPVAINPALQKDLPYQPMRDFVMVNGVFAVPLVFVAGAQSPYKTLNDVVAAAKAKPGQLDLGVPSIATIQHIAAEAFKRRAGAPMTSVQYRGSSMLLTDLLGGHVPLAIDSVSTVLEYVRSGKLRALAVTSETRIPQMPDVPTVAELGYPGFQAVGWVGVLAPKNTPAERVEQISADVRRALARPDVQEKIRENGAVVDARGTQEWSAFVEKELVEWQRIVKDANIKVE